MNGERGGLELEVCRRLANSALGLPLGLGLALPRPAASARRAGGIGEGGLNACCAIAASSCCACCGKVTDWRGVIVVVLVGE